MLKDTPLNKGGNPNLSNDPTGLKLKDIRLTRDQSSDWQRIELLPEDISKELWIAREMLSKVGRNWNKSSDNKTWAEYCEEIGSSKQVVNKWHKQWFGNVWLNPTYFAIRNFLLFRNSSYFYWRGKGNN